MKKLLLLISTVITLTAKAQTSVYHPFPEDTATWLSDKYDAVCMGYCGSIYYKMKGDTIINNHLYNKIYRKVGNFYYITFPPNSSLGANFGACSYLGGIRQDSINKKVYYIDSTMTTDTLLYDFDLTIGDTIYNWYSIYNQYPMVVTSIDSVYISSSYHKVFNFDNTPTFFGKSLIEGVGWAGDLFSVKPGVDPLYLVCFNSDIILGFGFFPAFANECSYPLDCSIFVDINEPNAEKYFNLFPNPFSDKLNITINNQEPVEVLLYDITSRKLLQQKFTSTVTLNTEQLAKGLYLYEVRDKDGVRKKGKVVKD